MPTFASRVVLSWGWERRLIAFAAGAVGVLALQPIGFAPAFFVPMTVAVWLLDGCAGKRAARGFRSLLGDMGQAAEIGWWLGFGYFLGGLWWIGAAFLVDAGDFAWAMPLAVIGVPALLAFFTAAGFAIARLLWSAGGARVFALAAALGLSEWARGHLLSGFPWNAFGMALGPPLLAQSASLFGLYGLTVLAVALFAAPALSLDHLGGPGPRRGLTIGPIVAVLGWVALLGFGAIRLSHDVVRYVPDVRLRIMQPNLQQDEKFQPKNGEQILAAYLSLSDRAASPQSQGVADVTHLIWPESAFPFILSRSPNALALISQALAAKTILITGAARMDDGGGADKPRYYNSIQAIGPGGLILDDYDKIHLVPFGEYLPFQSALEKLGIQDLVRLPGGFSAGRAHKLLEVPGLPPILPLICYEAIFPIESRYDAPPGVRPGLLLNVTNDGWFGRTFGPYQHFAQARLRAIEEGLPLVRAANTGISAIVDPYGRVMTQLPLGAADVLDGGLPQGIDPPIFARHPILSFFIVWLLALGGSFLAKPRF